MRLSSSIPCGLSFLVMFSGCSDRLAHHGFEVGVLTRENSHHIAGSSYQRLEFMEFPHINPT